MVFILAQDYLIKDHELEEWVIPFVLDHYTHFDRLSVTIWDVVIIIINLGHYMNNP